MAESKHTPGPWKAIAQGGSSTVVSECEPARNDNRIPAYGYRRENGFCIGAPFIEDDGRIRLDFVDFSHDDARLIAAAPDMLAALRDLLAKVDDWAGEEAADTIVGVKAARAALAKAEGRSNG